MYAIFAKLNGEDVELVPLSDDWMKDVIEVAFYDPDEEEGEDGEERLEFNIEDMSQ